MNNPTEGETMELFVTYTSYLDEDVRCLTLGQYRALPVVEGGRDLAAALALPEDDIAEWVWQKSANSAEACSRHHDCVREWEKDPTRGYY